MHRSRYQTKSCLSNDFDEKTTCAIGEEKSFLKKKMPWQVGEEGGEELARAGETNILFLKKMPWQVGEEGGGRNLPGRGKPLF